MNEKQLLGTSISLQNNLADSLNNFCSCLGSKLTAQSHSVLKQAPRCKLLMHFHPKIPFYLTYIMLALCVYDDISNEGPKNASAFPSRSKYKLIPSQISTVLTPPNAELPPTAKPNSYAELPHAPNSIYYLT